MTQQKVGDIFAIQNKKHKKWLLWQVIGYKNGDSQTGILLLDWFSDKLPSEKELQQVKPLWIDHHSWKGNYEALYVMDPPPASAQWIANIPPLIELKINAYGGGWYPSTRQFEWMTLPVTARDAYKKALESNNKVLVMGRERKENSTSLWLYEKNGENQWKDLDKLAALNEIHYEGADSTLIDYLKTRPILEKLEWKYHSHEVLDLSATHLRELIIDISSLRKLRIPDSLAFLSLIGDYSQLDQLIIEQASQGKHLCIHMHYLNQHPIPNFSLIHLDKLSLRTNQLDIALIAKYYPNLFSLHAWGNPGVIHNLDQLKNLHNFVDLQLMDFFGFTEQDFPHAHEMPNLERLWLTSIPESVGKWAKKEYKLIDPNISKLRKEAWLAANLNNPFRAWDGRDGVSPSKAKKAFDAFKKACTQIEKLREQPHCQDAAKKIIADFVDIFNKMDAKSGIDTLEREEIADVFSSLVMQMNVDRNTYDDYFDSIRDF